MTTTDRPASDVQGESTAMDRDEIERIHRESYATYPLDLLEFVVRDPEMQRRIDHAEMRLWFATMLRDAARDELMRRQEQRS